jgi:hypothetical protein
MRFFCLVLTCNDDSKIHAVPQDSVFPHRGNQTAEHAFSAPVRTWTTGKSGPLQIVPLRAGREQGPERVKKSISQKMRRRFGFMV